MLELRSVSGGYAGETKLHGVTLSVPDGTILTLVGPNGSGKSTLLRIMGGLQKPYDGEILLDGTPVAQIERRELARKLSYLPQSRNIPSISVNAMVLHGRFPYLGYPRRYRPEDRQIAAKAMERMGILELRSRDMGHLSGGERQKVYLAMLLAQEAQTVLMDEPATYLDIAHQLEVVKTARRLRASGKTVVMALHDVNLALCYSDLVAVLREGRMETVGSPAVVYESGILDEVFGVRVIGQTVEGTLHYFCREKERGESDGQSGDTRGQLRHDQG